MERVTSPKLLVILISYPVDLDPVKKIVPEIVSKIILFMRSRSKERKKKKCNVCIRMLYGE